MIKTTPDCIGRTVLYKPHSGPVQTGTITHYNDSFVFVRHRDNENPKATRREDLWWGYRNIGD